MSRRELLLESCEDRILCDAAPEVALNVPANVKIGDTVQITATFDNASATDTGFGPYIDLVLKATGTDGAGAAVDDGVTFINATYLGTPVTATVLTFDALGQAVHPYAKDVSGNPVTVTAPAGYGAGDQLIVLQLPFGSFSPTQPPAAVTINLQTSNLADANQPLGIAARGGFQYGNDALDNPTTDPSLIDPTYANATITPTLFTLSKTYLGPEDETATGPNFLRQYRLDLDVATGQTLTNVDLSDLLPSGMQFTQLISATPAGSVTSTPSTTTPGGTFTYRFSSVTGVAGVDASVTIEYYVPRLNSGSAVIVNASSGDDVALQNNASASGNWTPIDTRDTATTVTVNPAGPEHTLTAKSIATQKGVSIVSDTGAPGATPGDTLEYTIQVQVSDYFAFQNLVLTDLFSDGQRFDTTFTPTFSWNEQGSAFGAVAFGSANYTVAQNFTGAVATPPIFTLDPAANDGNTTVTFRVSNEMISRGSNGNLVGGGIPLGGTGAGPLPNNPPLPFGPTTATIRFRTVIQDTFSDNFPSGNNSLNPGDVLTNSVSVSGDLLQVTNVTTPTGQSEADGSGASVSIVPPTVVKSIYAINGSTTLPVSPTGAVLVRPGDTLTYRLQYTVPTGDVENLTLSDYLPLPIFNATQVTTFSAIESAAAPAAGVAKWGPNESLRDVAGTPVPTISSNATNNLLTFSYPANIDDPTNTPRTVDILFTVTVGAQPFADGLFLTNQVQASENNTQQPATATTSNAIIQVQLQEPVLALQKGVVGYNSTGLTLGGITFNAPGAATTFSGGAISNATQLAAIGASNVTAGPVDAGDAVRYALVLQNSGRSDAYDARFTDQIINPGYNLPVGGTDAARLTSVNFALRRGDGTLLVAGTDYTATLTAAGLLTVTMTDTYSSGNVGTETGQGALSRGFNASTATAITNGSNTLIATYDLTLTAGVLNAGATITNTATLTNYSSLDGGTDFTTTDPTDTATVTTPRPTLAKVLTGTEVTTGGNSNTQAVIGELVTYTITLTVPEGSVAAAQLTDTLDAGLAFVDITSVVLSSGLATSNTIGTGTAPSNVTVGGSGRNLAFNFGTITNTDTNNAAAETITIVYRAVVIDTNTLPSAPGNQTGTLLNNSASFSGQYTDRPTGTAQSYTTAIASAANVTVIEPVLTVAKNVASTVGGPFSGTLSNVDAGDAAFYQIVITNTGAPTAFELFLNDNIPAALGSLSVASVATIGFGATPAPVAGDFQVVSNVLSINAGGPRGGNIDVPAGATITIVVQGSLVSTVQPNQNFDNNATIRWTSMDGAVGTRSSYDAASTERSGGTLTPAVGVNASSDNTILDNYAATSGNARITIANPVPVKTIDATSESSTTNVAGTERVTIGEIVRYRLTWRLPEGVSQNLVFTDQLPTGLQFLNDGTATLAFVSLGNNLTSSIAAIGSTPNQAGDQTTLASINPQFVIPAAQITPVTPGNGSDPVFSLGNVTNTANNSNDEYVVIEFNAIVLNVVGNQRFDNVSGADNGTANRANTVNVTVASNGAGQTSTAVNVGITEPAITNVTKTVTSSAPYDAGNDVIYQVTFSNVNDVDASTAFDIALSDILPAFLTNVRSLTLSSLGTVVGLAGSITGNTVNVSATSMAINSSVTITYTATLVASVPANQIVSNTANLTYSSLPGTGPALDDGVATTTNSAPGAVGSATGERSGANGAGADASFLNNYADSGTITVTTATPTLDKTFKDGSISNDDTNVTSSTGASVVVGEQVTYDILVTLPEGVTQSLNIVDAVPAGLRVDGFQILTTTAAAPLLTGNFNGSFTTTPLTSSLTGAGNLTLNFGNTTVVNDNVTTNNSFVIRVQATVLNILANQAAVTRTNTATLTYTNPNTATTATVTDGNTGNNPTVTVVEPAIVTTKTVSDSTPDSSDPISYTITLSNTSGQTAYDVSLSDVLPSALVGPSITSVAKTGTIFINGVSGTPVANTDVVLSGGTLQFAGGSNIDIATGSTITIVVTGTVASTATPNLIVTNNANVSWTSMDATITDERTGADGVGGALNDYASTGTVNFTVPQGAFAKQLLSTSEASTTGSNVTIGETATYALIVTLPEGTTPGLSVTDVLPPGLQYVGYSIVTSAAASSGLLTADFAGALPVESVSGGVAAGDDVVFTFGSISVVGDNIAANNKFLILVTARVLNVAGNVGFTGSQTVLPNAGTFDITGDGIAAFTTPNVNVTVVEPNMAITKDINLTNADAGDTVTITLVVTNNGTSNAYDVIVNDPFPAGKFTSFTAGTTAAGFTFGTSGDTVTFTGGTINAGASATFTFTAVLTTAVAPNELLTNTATVTQATTLPGTVAGERDEPDVSGSDTVRVPVAALSKTLFATSESSTSGTNVTIGETVTYALRVTLPEGTTPANVVVVDLLPAGMQYVSHSLFTTVAGSGGLLTADFGGTVASPVRSGSTGNGDDQTFTFSAITTNGDNLATNNSFLILVTAQVLDVVGNAGVTPPGQTTLANTASLTVPSGGGTVTTPAVNVTVVEPRMTITKNIVQTSGDAGDTVTITLTVNNTGTSNAYEVIVNDPFPAGKFTTFTAGTTPAGFTFGTSGDTVTFTGGTINAGATATFTFTAVLTSAVAPGEVLNNTATVTQATTLPGTVTGERDEPDVNGSDSIAVPVGSYVKSIFSTSDANTTTNNAGIGETITYALKVTLPEGATSNLSIVDLLPAGLQYVSHSLFTTATGSGGLLAADFVGSITGPVRSGTTGDGDDQTFAFSSISVTNDNTANNNSFLLLVTARVTDVVGNVGLSGSQTTLNNQATFDIPTDGSPLVTTPNVPAVVVEPRLQITKGASDNTPDPGQTLTYTLTITHTATSTAIAYDVLLRDAIPTGLTLNTGSVSVTGATIDSNSSTGSLLDLKFTELALGGTITVTYTATLSTSIALAGTNLDNTAKIYWDTDPAEDTNVILSGGTDGTPDRDLGAGPGNEVFNVNTDPAQDTERVTVNASTISGVVYRDLNANGSFGGADTGIDGVTVQLNGTDLNGNVIALTTTTAGGGLYSFTGLTAGVYTITETQPVGFTDALETVGSNFSGAKSDALDSNTITTVTIPVQTSATGAGYNFGEVLPSSVAGSVYYDANNDGVRQGGETGIATVPVRITGTDVFGQAVSTDGATDGSGNFAFSNGGTGLRPGTYTITELTQPTGYFDGRETAGTLGGSTATNEQIGTFTLPTNTAATGYLFGELLPASLSGFVYADLDTDGVKDGFETGIPSVTVTLTGSNDLGAITPISVTTDATGAYSFTGLRPGTYTITETQPSGYADGADTIGTPGGTTSNDVFSAVVLAAGVNGVNNNYGESPTIGLTKSLETTSVAATTGTAVVVGEVATFRLVATIPVGSFTNFQIQDALPPGYEFIDGSARVGLISTAGQLTSSTITAPLTSLGAPTVLLGDLDVSTSATAEDDTYGSGTDVFFKIGNLTNTDTSAGTTEAVVIEFQARVVNESANQAATALANTFSVLFDKNGTPTTPEPHGGGSNIVTTTVAEPNVTITKTANPTSGVDAGDVITYTVTLTNPGGANSSTAFDTLFVDTIPANLLVTGITSTTLSGATSDSAVAIIGGGTGLTGQFDITAGGSVTIVYTATVQVGFPPNGSLTNAAVLTWTSLDGGNSTTPDAGERYGAGTNIFGDGSLDDYRRTTNATTTGNGPTFSKTLFATSDTNTTLSNVAIGETVTYALLVTLPEGTTSSFNIADALPDGLRYVSHTLATTTGAGNPLTANFNGTVPAPTFIGGATDGADLNFAFGTITTNPDNVASNNTFAIMVTAVVTDRVSNVGVNPPGQTVLGNTATFSGTGIPPTTPPSVDVTVVEPRLQITKTVDDATADLGQTLNFTLTIAHTASSTQTAYDLLVRDALPAGLTGLANIVVTGATVDTNSSTGTVLDLKLTQLAVGSTVTITFTANVGTAAALTGTNIDNNARLYWDSTAADTGSNAVLTGAPDGDDDRDYGATGADEVFNANTQLEQDTERVTINGNTISGFVYRDADASGTRNGAETGLGVGVTITLTGTTFFGQNITQTVTADATTGAYSFSNVPRGTYTITETPPAGFVDGLETVGTIYGGAKDDALNVDTITNVVVPTGSNSGINYNFGELLASSLAGQVYQDFNNNGVIDGGETTINGVNVALTGTDVFGQALSVPAATTAGTGSYAFTGLRPSNASGYTLTETQPAGLLDGRETVGTQASGTVVNNADNQTIAAIALGQNVNGAGNNFGELPSASLAGNVYADLDGDGIFDAGETGIAGATVTLTGTNDRGAITSIIATTNASGAYSFTNLRPGTYTITQTQPAGYADGLEALGTGLSAPNNAGSAAVNDLFSAIAFATVAPGNNTGINYNFGEIVAFAPIKTLQTTNVAGTSGSNLAVGEVATFRLVATIPTGTFTDLQIQDVLPPGFQYVSGSAFASLVSAGGQLTSSTLSGAGLAQTSIGTPTFALPDAAVSNSATVNVDAYASGTDVFFKLGTLTNTDSSAATTEAVVIEFQALVLNEVANQAATSLPNTFNVLVDRGSGLVPQGPPSNTVPTTVVEPVLAVTKTLAVSGTDSGDAVQYTITITNAAANNATAYDINVLDAIDADLLLNNVTLGSGIVVSGATVTTNGSTTSNLSLVLDSLAAGASATITLNATVVATAPVGSTVANSTTISWTSTPGTNADERTGGGGLDDYTDTASSANFVLARPQVDKLVPADTTYSIGETVTYDILVTLPEGVTRDLAITDNLPAGLDFVSAAVQTTAGGALATAFGGPTPTFSTANVGNSYTFTFGNTPTTNDNNAANNSFLVRVTARVGNVIGNQDTVVLTNTATLAYTDGTNGASTVNDPTPNVNITVVEPVLTLDKQALGTTTGLDAGDTVQFRIVITNTGTATAHETLLSDALPAGLLITSIDSTTSASGASIDTATGGTGTAALSGEYTIPVGGSITILYTATLQSAVTPNTSYTNTATVTFSSVDGTALGQGTPDGERIGVPPNIQGDGSLNDYRLQDAAQVSTGGVLTVAKGVNNTTPTIGDVLTYTVTLTLNEGTTNGIVVTDTLPASGDLQYVAGSAVISFGTTGSTISGSATPAVSGANSNVLTFTLGDSVIPAGAGANTVTLTYQVLVTNVTTNQAGDLEINSAGVVATNLPPPPPGTTTVTLREPVLNFSKSASTAGPVQAGDTVNYTLTITNPGGANASTAFDALVRDLMPTDIRITSITGVVASAGVSTDAAVAITGGGTGLSGQFDIPVGESVTINYIGTVQVTATPGAVETNNAELTWTSVNGNNSLAPDANERFGATGSTFGDGSLNDYRRVDARTVTVGTATFAKQLFTTSDANTPASDVGIGETVTYALVVTIPNGTTPSLAIVDTLPAGLQFVSSSVITTAAASGGLLTADFNGNVPAPTVGGGASDGDDVTFNFGSIVANADSNATNNTFLVLVTTRVTDIAGNEGVLPGQTTLDNTAQFDIPGDGVPPTTPPPVTVTVIEPQLKITKAANISTPSLGQTVHFTLTIAHTAASSGPAYDILVRDPLPAGLGALTNITVTGATIDANNSTATLLDLKLAQLAVGSTITVEFDATVSTSSAFVGATIDNNARLYWDSQAAESANSVLTGAPDGDGDRDYGATGPDEAFNTDPQDAQDTERLTVPNATLRGTIYHDVDASGGFAGGTDTGLNGQTVRLTGTSIFGETINLTATTAPDGSFAFVGVAPSDAAGYTLTEVQPTGYTDAAETPGTTFGGTASPALNSNTITGLNVPLVGGDGAGYNFGEVLPSSLAGSVYLDSDNNGTRQPAEQGIAGSTIRLTGVDFLGETVDLTATTDSDGNFIFDNGGTGLRPGTYQLEQTPQPAGYLDGKETAGPNGGDATTTNEIISGIGLDQNIAAVDYLFGELPIPPVIVPPADEPAPEPDKERSKRPEPFVFAFDSFNNFANSNSDRNEVSPWISSIDIWGPAMLPLAPIYSGAANPGATLVIDLYNANGVHIGSQTVIADAGGNWLANFTSVVLRDAPSEVRITQVNAPYSFGSGTGHNLRTYYAPAALNPGHFLGQTVQSVLDNEPAPLLGGLDLANPIALGPVKYGGEFLASEGVASSN